MKRHKTITFFGFSDSFSKNTADDYFREWQEHNEKDIEIIGVFPIAREGRSYIDREGIFVHYIELEL